MDLCEQSPVMLCQPSWCWEDRNVPAGGVGWKTNHIFLMRQDLIPRFGQVREHHIPFTGNKLLHWWGILLCFIPKCSCVYRGTINSTIYWNVFIDWQYFHFQGDLAIKRNWRKPHFFCLSSCSPHLGLAYGLCWDPNAPCFPWLEEKPLQMVTLPIPTQLWCLSWVLKIYHDALVHRAESHASVLWEFSLQHQQKGWNTKSWDNRRSLKAVIAPWVNPSLLPCLPLALSLFGMGGEHQVY